LIYLRQEGRAIGLADKLRSYVLQKAGDDTVDANIRLGHAADERTYDAAARILQDLGVVSIVLLTNSPGKISAIKSLGVRVVGVEEVTPVFRDENRRYLLTKATRMGHTFTIPDA
jgi:GTP cyclohydrolase II